MMLTKIKKKRKEYRHGIKIDRSKKQKVTKADLLQKIVALEEKIKLIEQKIEPYLPST